MVEIARSLGEAFDMLYGTSPDAVAVARDDTIIYTNRAYQHLHGAGDDVDYVGESWLDQFAPMVRPSLMVQARATGNALPPTYHTRARRGDGSEFVTEVRELRFQHDAVTYRVLLQTAIEEPASPPPGLDDSLYRAVFNVNTAIKLLIDPVSGAIVDANEPATNFYGWSLDELRSMRITDINQLSPSEVRQEMNDARSGRRGYFCFRHNTASGEVRHVEVHSGPLDVGSRRLLLSIIHDVTERDALADQLRASQQLEAVGRLAGGVAHEFNNLLTVVLNGSTMLLRKMPSDSPLRRYLEDMSFASERAADLTRDLLAFSRRQVMAPQSLDINDVVERMSGMLQRSLGASITIVNELAADLPSTRSDPRQLEHVLMNLVLNAKDAMPRGGEIIVRTSLVEIEDDNVGPVPPGQWVSLQVIDEGEGMDAETQARLFEPFFTTKEKARGTGLGMATVYGIITQSGGHIRVQSAPGQGAELEVLLPVSDEDELPSVPVRASSAPTPTATVLLVDDMDAVRRSLMRSLEGFGFHVLDASSMDEALEVWRTHGGAVEALVTDIVMPGGSGIELAHRLSRERPSLLVLMISGDLRGHNLGRLPPGARKLQKPVTAECIAEELGAMLSARH